MPILVDYLSKGSNAVILAKSIDIFSFTVLFGDHKQILNNFDHLDNLTICEGIQRKFVDHHSQCKNLNVHQLQIVLENMAFYELVEVFVDFHQSIWREIFDD